jgi:hypothetical protein
VTKLRITAVAAIATAALAAGSALAGGSAKVTPFTAKYAGTAVVKVTNDVADISAIAKGTGTPIGAGTLSGKGTGNTAVQPCVPFGGLGTMTGAKGTKLSFTVVSGAQGCGDQDGEVFSVSGRIKVLKGAGKLLTARGSLKFTGVYDRSAGTFSVKFTGSLTG